MLHFLKTDENSFKSTNTMALTGCMCRLYMYHAHTGISHTYCRLLYTKIICCPLNIINEENIIWSPRECILGCSNAIYLPSYINLCAAKTRLSCRVYIKSATWYDLMCRMGIAIIACMHYFPTCRTSWHGPLISLSIKFLLNLKKKILSNSVLEFKQLNGEKKKSR